MTQTSFGKWKKTGSTLGQGGQGAVYEVVSVENPDGPRYAMKVLGKSRPTKALERFHREIEALKKLDHPNILKVIDHSDLSSENHFLVVELLEKADTLRTLLQDRKSPCFADPMKGLDFFMVLLDVIGECTKHGIVHRDLSPANVLFLSDGKIKVIDFGLCQFEDAERLTLIHEGVGTPNYMAPETESGSDQEITFKADLYIPPESCYGRRLRTNSRSHASLQSSHRRRSATSSRSNPPPGIYNTFSKIQSEGVQMIDSCRSKRRFRRHTL